MTEPTNLTMEFRTNGSWKPAAGRRPPNVDRAADTIGAVPVTRPLSPRDSYASTAFGDVFDRSLHAAVARLTAGLSPAALRAIQFTTS